MNKLPYLLFLSFMSAGCAIAPAVDTPETLVFAPSYQQRHDLSFANNVLGAGGLGPIKETERARDGSGGLIPPAFDVLVHHFAGINPTGLLSSGLVKFGSYLAEPRAPESFNHVFYWIPDNPTMSPLQAEIVAGEDFKKAVSTTLSYEIERGDVLELELTELPDLRLYGYKIRNCNDRIFCRIAVAMSKKHWKLDKTLHAGIQRMGLPYFHASPDKKGFHVRAQLESPKKKKEKNSLVFWQGVSEQLPPYAYVYLAPFEYSFQTKFGDFQIANIPVIINKGNIHYFIKNGL